MTRLLLVLGLFLAFLPLAGQQVEDLGLSLEQLEDKLFVLVNRERSGRGLAELRPDPGLRAVARAHSLKMIQEKSLAHDFPGYEELAGRAARAGLYFSGLGENVARGDTFVMRFYHEQLLASPGHRENVLNAGFRQLGIGIGLSGGVYYVTQEFASLFDPIAPEEMEGEIESELAARLGRLIPLPRAAAAMKDNCRRLASLSLNDQSPRAIIDEMGVAVVHNYSFVEKQDGLGRLSAEIKESRPLYWALGAAFGRSQKNPGGCYALSLILFPDLRDELDIYSGLDTVVLQALQKIRPMGRAPHLERAAAEIAMRFYQSADSPGPSQIKHCKLIQAYQTPSLAVIPDDIAQQIAGAAKISAAAIHVLYPLLEGLTGNYFIVSILAN